MSEFFNEAQRSVLNLLWDCPTLQLRSHIVFKVAKRVIQVFSGDSKKPRFECLQGWARHFQR
jgi:hypothetical protein